MKIPEKTRLIHCLYRCEKLRANAFYRLEGFREDVFKDSQIKSMISGRVAIRMYFQGKIRKGALLNVLGSHWLFVRSVSSLPERWGAK